jgi:hypothetical protein
MKIITLWIATIFILLSFIPVQLKASKASNSLTVPTNKTTGSETANALLNRLFEINGLNKSALSLSEKKELRKEVRTIRDDLKKLDGGIYLSVGAIIIILLILILLL